MLKQNPLTTTQAAGRTPRIHAKPRWAAAIFDRGRLFALARRLPLLALTALAPALPSHAQTDTTAPTITSFELDLATATPTSAQMVVTFSEPVTGVDVSDFAINTTLTAGATITGVTAGTTAASYRVAFNYSGASGSVQMAIKTTGAGITDTAGNAFVGRGVAATLAYPVNNAPPPDTTLPGITSFTAPATVTTSPVQLTVVFGEAVTGVSADDFLPSAGATIGTVTGSGTTWTVPVSFTGTAPVTVTAIGGATANIRDTASHWFPGGATSPSVTFTPTSAGAVAPVISSPLTASVNAGAAFTYTVAGTNSPTSLTATGLPTGLAFTSPTISGSVATPGTYNITLGASNTAGSDTKTLVLTVNAATTTVPVVSSPLTASVTAGSPFSYTVTGTNSPTALTATGLPTGLTYTSPTISGTVATPGVYNITVGASNSAGSDTKTLVLTVNPATVTAPVVSSPLTASVTAGSTFSYTLTGTNSPTALTATGLPTGLTFTSPTISGTVATPGVYNITVGASNSAGSDTKTLVLTVNPLVPAAPAISSPLTANVTAGSAFSYTVTGTNSPTALTATGLPTGLTYTSPTISGTVTTPGIYNITLGATNAVGTDTKTLVLTVNPVVGAPVHVLSVTPPPNGTYTQGQTITFTLMFSAPVTVSGVTTDDTRPYFTWTAVSSTGTPSTGRVRYVSGSGTSVLTFSYQVDSDDVAANGITLGTTLQLPTGVTLRDSSGANLTGTALTLPWTTNPLAGVIFRNTGGNDGKGQGPVTVLHGNLQPGVPFTLPATTPSGQAITWILVSGNATLQGNVLTPKNRGAVVLRAVVAGSSPQATPVVEFDGDTDDDTKGPGKSHRDRLSNLSSRLRVFSNDPARSAIAGFVVTGSAPKQVLLRAVGPGLSDYNVADAAAAVRLQLHDPAGRIMAVNDGWNGDAALAAAAERVGAFKLKAGSRDSAMLMTLAPGAYTAQVGSSANGIALIEVYDATSATQSSTEQLINISTRGQVDTGEGNLIAGFIVTGESAKRVLIRGIGPSLARYNVTGVVADPVLELMTASGTTVLARNDNWEAPQQAMFGLTTAAEVTAATRAAGAFPLDAGSKDAAILVTLMPGAYSAVVRGANGTTGTGLVEVYEVPDR